MLNITLGIPFENFLDYLVTVVCVCLFFLHLCADLKPGNIFLLDDVCKLGDLGLSRYFSSKTHEVFSIVGTPNYMRYPSC